MKYVNPFATLADLLRGLRQRLVAELQLAKNPNPPMLTPRLGEFLGALNGLINECEAMRAQVELLETKDPRAFAAFERAIEDGKKRTEENTAPAGQAAPVTGQG